MAQKTRLVKVARSALARSAVALTCFLALSGFGSWFSRPLVNGYYGSRGSNAAVVMIHLVEAPRGHLSGAQILSNLPVERRAVDIAPCECIEHRSIILSLVQPLQGVVRAGFREDLETQDNGFASHAAVSVEECV
ncbi:MAG: hypothetical protein M0038_22035 [Pseudomonadota bacterium]|jgi:hypothetical protein|nr:hypothetical protein [Pseudomonadota bacterium]